MDLFNYINHAISYSVGENKIGGESTMPPTGRTAK